MYNVEFPGIGIELVINPVAFSIGSFNIYWYGICIALGMSLALVYFFYNSKRFGVDPDKGLDVIIVSGIAAILGARIYYVIFSPYPFDDFMDMIDIRDGGVAIYGAIIAAFIVAIPMCKIRKVAILPMFDVAAIGFLIGQGIGRWGNFFNQEAFGTNTDSFIGMYSEGTNRYLTSLISSNSALASVLDATLPVHPTFLYESIWCLLCFVGLALYSKRRKFNGEIFLLYLLLYGAERAVVEGLRTDSLMLMNARVSQILAVALSVAALITLIVFYTSEKLRSRKMFVLLDEFVPSQNPKDETVENSKTEELEGSEEESETLEQDETADEAEPEVEEVATKDSDEETEDDK